MAHNTAKSAYQRLSDRLNRFPQGAPPREVLYSILKILMSEQEASLVALLPIKPFTVATAARCWKMANKEAHLILDQLASRAILIDVEKPDHEQTYFLPPPMAGFFEFSMMRLRGDINQKLLSELYYQYVTVEDDFILDLLTRGETQPGRVFVQERVLDNALYVLDYERASHVINTAVDIGISMCYCRHKKLHLDLACDAPMDICMTFGSSAHSLIKHGYARRVESVECLDLLDQAYEHNLVQFGENVQQGVNFICNCCKCCCEAMIAAQKFGLLNPVHTTNYLPVINEDTCNGCGLCTKACPVDALKVTVNENNSKVVKLDEQICLGCGVCVRSCHKKAIIVKARAERVVTPVDSTHRTVMMAIERGTLQHLIFDNQAHLNHRAMAAILGVILKLPIIKQVMASKQMKSRYLERIITWYQKNND